MYIYAVTLKACRDHLEAESAEYDLHIDADTAEHAISALQTSMEIRALSMIKAGDSLPEPIKDLPQDKSLCFITLDYDYLLKEASMTVVKRTISLPEWLDNRIRRSGIDSSKLFREAALKELATKGYPEITTVEELKKRVPERVLKKYITETLAELLPDMAEERSIS